MPAPSARPAVGATRSTRNRLKGSIDHARPRAVSGSRPVSRRPVSPFFCPPTGQAASGEAVLDRVAHQGRPVGHVQRRSTRWMWFSTVRGDSTSRVAICRAVSPSTTSARTSASRAVSRTPAARGSGRPPPGRPRPAPGSTPPPPWRCAGRRRRASPGRGWPRGAGRPGAHGGEHVGGRVAGRGPPAPARACRASAQRLRDHGEHGVPVAPQPGEHDLRPGVADGLAGPGGRRRAPAGGRRAAPRDRRPPPRRPPPSPARMSPCRPGPSPLPRRAGRSGSHQPGDETAESRATGWT